jgi:hypothetical protein
MGKRHKDLDWMDLVALWGRRYERQSVPGSNRTTFTLAEVLEAFDRVAVLELTCIVGSRPGVTVRPDPIKKVTVSLLDDGISPLHSSPEDRYEVFRTAPTGDAARARIVARTAQGARLGEIRLLTGRKIPDHYFRKDLLLDAMARHFSTRPRSARRSATKRRGRVMSS